MNPQAASSDFPFESRYLEVRGSRIHYIEQGEGRPVLFLHGNPTSCYLWRNVIPHLGPGWRAIAPDLIGMGRSDKPTLHYGFFDHVRYLDGFIENLGLRQVTLVVHDWGSALGFHYARRHQDNVRALAFMEAIVKPLQWSDMHPGFRRVFTVFRTPIAGWMAISVMNVFVRRVLPWGIMRSLSGEEMARYAEPYPTIGSRTPVRRWPCEIPIEGKPRDVFEAVAAYSHWLQKAPLPKLFFSAYPGAINRRPIAEWIKRSLPNLKAIDLGKGLHYLQEDHPHEIGEGLAAWLGGLQT